MRVIHGIRAILLLFCIIFYANLYSQNEYRILFVGNSYTYFNDLPAMIKEISLTTGKKITVESSTPGGATFQNHCNNATMQKIKNGGWDVVVLQEKSQLPSLPDSQFEVEVYHWAKMLVDTIYKYNDCVLPMFYMTWGRKNGDAANGVYFPVLSTYEGMDSMLCLRYMLMKDSFNTAVSPVGRVWRYIRRNFPSIELYETDGSHPSLSGSYAAALTFYSMLFKDSPNAIKYNPGISENEMTLIKQAVDSVVYNHYEDWQRDSLTAKMKITAVSESTYLFESETPFATTFYWDFGDGNSSDLPSIEHTFLNSGTFQVILKTGRCLDAGYEDSVSTLINVSVPAPTDNIFLDNKIENVIVYTILGVEVWRGKYSDFIKKDECGVFLVRDVDNDVIIKIVK